MAKSTAAHFSTNSFAGGGAADRLTRALRTLSSDLAGLTGEDLFRAVSLFLTSELQVDFAFVGLSEDDASVRTLALAHGNRMVENVTYELDGTPCADVADHTFCMIGNDAAGIYPGDALLSEMAIQAYAGVRLSSRDGEPIGMLSVMSTAPLETDQGEIEGLLRLMGLRVQGELDRHIFSRTEESLRISQEQLEQVVEERTRDLRASEQRIRGFADAASDWFWEMGPDLRFTYFSPRVEEKTGVPIAYHLGKTREELAGEDASTSKWQKHLQDLRDRKPFRDFRYVRQGPGGRLHYLSSSGKPVFDDDGAFRGYIGTGSDITHQVQAEERARLANERIVAAVDAFPDPITLWDRKDRLVIGNRSFIRVVKATPDAVTPGIGFRQMMERIAASGTMATAAGREKAWVEQRCVRHAHPGMPFEQQLANGTWLEVREHRLPDGGTMTISADITELKRAETEMRLSRERLGDFSSVAADWFWEQNEELRFTYMSQEIYDVMGIKKSETLGKRRDEIPGRGGGSEQFKAHARVLAQHLPFDDFRFDQIRPDGTVAHVSISGKPIFDDNGKFRGYRGAGRDISKIVKTEAALRFERDRAEAASRAKSEFLAKMSHDFRTPLNAILGFSQMLVDEALGPIGNSRYREYAGDIFRSGQVLLDFVNNLLDISKIEAGELSIEKSDLDVEDIVIEIRHLMMPRLREKSLNFNVSVAPDARLLHADRLALWHMLVNLLSNAVKFTPDNGNVSFEAHRRNGEITISVVDTGMGFDPSERNNILSPFGRGQNARASNIEGTGLGLPIVKAMVEAHDGRFELASGVGCGTRASLVFPSKSGATDPHSRVR